MFSFRPLRFIHNHVKVDRPPFPSFNGPYVPQFYPCLFCLVLHPPPVPPHFFHRFFPVRRAGVFEIPVYQVIIIVLEIGVDELPQPPFRQPLVVADGSFRGLSDIFHPWNGKTVPGRLRFIDFDGIPCNHRLLQVLFRPCHTQPPFVVNLIGI